MTALAAPEPHAPGPPAPALHAPARGRHRPVGRQARPRTLRARLLRALASLLFVVSVLVLLAMTVGPRVFGYRTATMLTGSMAPAINPGDVIVDTRVPATSVRVGQIITYHIPVQDHRVESHRVVWVGRSADGAVTVRTRGDANTADDPWTARLDEQTVWRVRSVVPFAGTVIRALRTPVVHVLLSAVLPALFLGWLLLSIWRPKGSKPTEPDDGSAIATLATLASTAAAGAAASAALAAGAAAARKDSAVG